MAADDELPADGLSTGMLWLRWPQSAADSAGWAGYPVPGLGLSFLTITCTN